MQEFKDKRINLALQEMKDTIKKNLHKEYGFLDHEPFRESLDQLLDQCLVESVSSYSQSSEKTLAEFVTEEFEEQLQSWLRDQIQNHHNYILLDLMILNKKKYVGKGKITQCIKGLTPIYIWLKNIGLDEDEEILQYVMNDTVVQTIAKRVDWKHLNLKTLEKQLTEDEMSFVYAYLMVFNIDVTTDNNFVVSEQSQKLTEKVVRYKNMPDGYKKEFLFEEILNENKSFLYKIVSRYYNSGVEQDDLMQQASLGLFTAIKRFEPVRNVAFSTYAMWWIRQHIVRYIYDHNSAIRIPVHLHEQTLKLRRVQEKLEANPSVTPTIEELSKESGLSVERIQTLQNIPTVSTSLNALVGDEDTELGSFFSDQTSLNYIEEIENDSIIQAFSKLLDEMKLSDRQKDITMRRLGLGPNGVETLEVIGADYGLTRERVRQIQAKVIKKLKNPKYINRMKELLKDPEKLPPKSGQELQKKEERKFLHVAWNVKSHVRPIKESQNQPRLLPPDKNALSEADVITVAETPQSESIEKEGEKKLMSEDKTKKKKEPKKPWKRIEGFYQSFLDDGFTKEEIDKAFETMTDNQKNIAYAKWGENLGEPIKATTKEQCQLQRQVSTNVIRQMKKKMLYYRQYGRFPQKGERTHMINEQLESLKKSGAVQTRKLSPKEIADLDEKLKLQKKAPQSASVSAILEQIQGNQSTPPQDAPKEEPIRSEIGKPVVILPDELPSRNELPSEDELPSDSVTNEEQPAVLPASDAKAMVPESVSAPIVATQPVPSLDRLPLDNCSLEQLTKLKNLLQSEAFTRLYQSLPLSESFVLISTFCLGKKSSEIADYMGTTKEKVDLAYDDAIELLGARLSDIVETNSSFSKAAAREEDLKVKRFHTNPLEPSSKN